MTKPTVSSTVPVASRGSFKQFTAFDIKEIKMDKAFEYLKTYNWGEDRNALNPIDEAVNSSHGDPEARQRLENRMIEVLQSDATRNGKDYVCRKLKVMGTDASVPALAAMLGDASHSHMARYALQSIPGDAASQALIDALDSVSGKLRAGVVGSLGARADNEAVPALSQLLGDGDSVVARAAALALGAIRSPDAAKALADAKPSDEVAGAVLDATLASAESLLASGDKLAALSIYKKLSSVSSARHIKLAATRGMLACAGK